MRNMAESVSKEQGDVPRAPPPSPELPQHQMQQFNFAELLSLASLKGNSPISSATSSAEHSRPTSPLPLFYPSPEHIRPTSGSVSPSEQPVDPNSLYNNFSSRLSELTLSCGTASSNNRFIDNQSMCGSVPVNGMGQLQSYANQQTLAATSNGTDFNIFLNSNQSDENCGNTGERRRKISLKRQHGDQEEYFYDTRSHGIEIINKKLCHGNDHVGSAPLHSRRSHTFSGSVNRTGSSTGDQLTVNTDRDSFQVGSLPGNHSRNRAFSTESYVKPSSECLSPGSLKTIGFSTNKMVTTDEQMEGIEMEEQEEQPPSIPIAMTTQMDWNSGGISLSSNVTPANNYAPQNSMNGFSFAQPTSSYTPSLSIHLTVPGFGSDSVPVSGFLTNQQDYNGIVPQITLTPHHFSKSL